MILVHVLFFIIIIISYIDRMILVVLFLIPLVSLVDTSLLI